MFSVGCSILVAEIGLSRRIGLPANRILLGYDLLGGSTLKKLNKHVNNDDINTFTHLHNFQVVKNRIMNEENRKKNTIFC